MYDVYTCKQILVYVTEQWAYLFTETRIFGCNVVSIIHAFQQAVENKLILQENNWRLSNQICNYCAERDAASTNYAAERVVVDAI